MGRGRDDDAAERARYEARVEEGGGRARQLRQHRLGRWNVRERVAALVDPGSWQEVGRYLTHELEHRSPTLAANRQPGDGVVAGIGAVDGRPAAVWGHDPTILRGALGAAAARKLVRLYRIAGDRRYPVIVLADSEGARVAEGMATVQANAALLREIARLRGRIPQLTLVAGICAGAAAYAAALGDLVAMVQGQSFLFVTGPRITQLATGRAVDIAELGSPAVHAADTGACHAVVGSEAEGIAWLRRMLAYLAPAAIDDPPERSSEALATLIPADPARGYDVRPVVEALFDAGSVSELRPHYAASLLTFLARLGGRTVAVLASQPACRAGALDGMSSRKGAQHIRLADSLGIPVVTLVDVPGYTPGVAEERAGALPLGAELIAAYAQASVPQLCLVLRKCYGGGNVLAASAEIRLALPTARVAPMGARTSVEVEHGALGDDAAPAERAERAAAEAAWAAEHDRVWSAAEDGYLDQIVEPATARPALVRALAALTGGNA